MPQKLASSKLLATVLLNIRGIFIVRLLFCESVGSASWLCIVSIFVHHLLLFCIQRGVCSFDCLTSITYKHHGVQTLSCTNIYVNE